MWMREIPLEEAPRVERRTRALAAALLRTASRALDSVATRLVMSPPADEGEALIEFHADAGAPEGALYVNGQLVGRVLGVNRL